MHSNKLQKLCIFFAGLLMMGVTQADVQSNVGGTTIQASEWKFSSINGRPDGRYIKDICLISEKAKIFTDQHSFLASYFGSYKVSIGRNCSVASLWADIDKRIVFVHSENNDMSDDQAVAAAKKTDVIAILEKSIREEYLDAYKSANTIKDIDDFELKFATYDPDGYIPLLQGRKRDLLHKQYKESFENASTSYQFKSFITDYMDNDPDGLIPLAKNKLDASEEQERANEARMKAEKEAEKENEARQKVEKKAELEKQIQASIIKYSSKIKSLGFSPDFLKSSIYLQLDAVNQPKKFITFETWLAGLFESGKFSNITKIKTKNSQGVLLKRLGMQSAGILFKMDNGDLFPNYLSNSEKAQPIESIEEQVAASMLIINAVTP